MALSQESQKQEQPEEPEQPMQEQAMQETQEAQASARKGKKRVVKKVTEADLQAISPRPSYWPLALAFAIVVFLYGAVGNEYIMGVGAVFVIAAVIGWGLERR